MRRIPAPRPRSFRTLLLGGLVVVALPLIAATSLAVVYVDQLASQSQRLIREGVRVTRLSQQLYSDIIDMERSVRQYAILHDPSLAASFRKHYQSFTHTLDQLAALEFGSVQGWDLAALRAQAQQLARAMAAEPAPEQKLRTHLGRFDRMLELARAIRMHANHFIEQELARIQATSKEVRLFLMLCAFALIPITLILMGLFTMLISRPFRQIEAAVRRLGEGDFSQPVTVSAPSVELDALGDQLDWMRRRLAALESEKNQFLQHMSHELKTPLASIREGSELLRDGALGDATREQSEVIDILRQNSLELTALIENLLDFAAGRQRTGEVVRDNLSLHEIAQRVVERHRLSIDTRDLRVTLPDESVRVHADRERLRLILDNLLANAVKFSPNGGTIRIRGRQDAGATSIEVSDEGPGIDKSERSHVFTPFYQAHADTGAHVRGTGIGLSVVREGVHAHGGSINIPDTERGTVFRIVLPTGERH